jgi:hypothetical protein
MRKILVYTDKNIYFYEILAKKPPFSDVVNFIHETLCLRHRRNPD